MLMLRVHLRGEHQWRCILATSVVPGLALLLDTVTSLTFTGLNALAKGFSAALLAFVTVAVLLSTTAVFRRDSKVAPN